MRDVKQGFIDAIEQSPYDDSVKLIYADWLEEQGEDLAEFIRTQVKLEKLIKQGRNCSKDYKCIEWAFLVTNLPVHVNAWMKHGPYKKHHYYNQEVRWRATSVCGLAYCCPENYLHFKLDDIPKEDVCKKCLKIYNKIWAE